MIRFLGVSEHLKLGGCPLVHQKTRRPWCPIFTFLLAGSRLPGLRALSTTDIVPVSPILRTEFKHGIAESVAFPARTSTY